MEKEPCQCGCSLRLEGHGERIPLASQTPNEVKPMDKKKKKPKKEYMYEPLTDTTYEVKSGEFEGGVLEEVE